ncbi:hypothetical protein L2D91_23790, partial [Salmonella enterica subsp. enterica serovar Weltevreden]|uniref:hypothetical protein n=1 Tax=Salmonella enterica TaxID=28901 RepID=UPI001F235AFF
GKGIGYTAYKGRSLEVLSNNRVSFFDFYRFIVLNPRLCVGIGFGIFAWILGDYFWHITVGLLL